MLGADDEIDLEEGEDVLAAFSEGGEAARPGARDATEVSGPLPGKAGAAGAMNAADCKDVRRCSPLERVSVVPRE